MKKQMTGMTINEGPGDWVWLFGAGAGCFSGTSLMAGVPERPVLSFWERVPPFAALAVARLGDVDIEICAEAKGSKDAPAVLKLPTGDAISGPILLRYLAGSGSVTALLGGDPLTVCQVDQWLEYSSNVVNSACLETVLRRLDDFLALRTYFVGSALSLADICLWGQLKGVVQWQKLRGNGSFVHLARWFDFLSILPALSAVEAEWGKTRKPGTNTEQKKGKSAEESSTLSAPGAASPTVTLPGAEMGKVVTRFPPEPSGYLHIGHVKAALLNFHFAQQYKGKMLLRFDDTNPTKEKDEFVDNILKDVADLGLVYSNLSYTSQHFEQLLDIAEKLIKAGKMYADDTSVEQMRQERMDGIESKCRKQDIKETLRLWSEMKAGSELGKQHCLRFRMDMQEPNKALRDPVVYRCNDTPHWRTGTKYKVYPTYDFACPFVDSYEGVTHALRTSEYKDREAQYQWILKEMQEVWPQLPNVTIWEFSRLNFVYTVLSKRKLQWFVTNGLVDGWDDPRFPTVQGMLRRGLQLEALREFILPQAASKNITLQEWDKIWTINKKLLDPVVPRHTAVDPVACVKLHLCNGPAEPERVEMPRHKKNEAAGKKITTRMSDIWLDQSDAKLVKMDEEVTLMDWGNCIIRAIEQDSDGTVKGLEGELHLEGDFKKTKLKLTWLPVTEELLPLTLVEFDYLISKKKLEEGDDFESVVKSNTRTDKAALGDPNMKMLSKGDVLQLERKGYFIVDRAFAEPGQPIVLFSIPDGRQKR
eukprot:evm.model.scf_402.2 EVM.evm.TU.scf_402.2   scf_402:7076-15125(+)